ncbi:aldose 1-epimerase family protein [Salinispira pacifica]
MEYRIENERFTATVAAAGAELRSLYDRLTGRELMWQADPAWWKGTAPVLFPVVGGLRNGSYRHGGREYRLPQHGFARGSQFRLGSGGQDWVELLLESGPATREVYPFEFRFAVRFALERVGLDVRYRVENSGTGEMLFSIGSHPAFNMPFDGGNIERYYLLFETEEENRRLYFRDGCIVEGRSGEVFESSRVVGLSRTMFDAGPIILPEIRSQELCIRKGGSSRSLIVRLGGAPSLGIWSKPGAPFVCIEPWFGLPDPENSSGELAEKPGILRLAAGDAWSGGWGVVAGW